MHRKYYLFIAIAHLFLSVSLLTPILVTTETKVGQGGTTSQIIHKLNLFQYISYDKYVTISFFMMLFAALSLIGGVFALINVFLKKPNAHAPKISFAFGFASAILGALQIDSKSYVFFVFCVISFFVISLSSIKLMKMQ